MCCLQVNISEVSKRLNFSVALACTVANPLLSLLVDEGYLFVVENGETRYLQVDIK